jgi:hypothetical protein
MVAMLTTLKNIFTRLWWLLHGKCPTIDSWLFTWIRWGLENSWEEFAYSASILKTPMGVCWRLAK